MTLPEGFLDEIRRYPQLAHLADSLVTPPSVSIRLNGCKAKDLELFPGAEKVAWCEDGWYLEERPQFTFDPAFHQGLYYVQDASSMAITAALRQISPKSPIRYLDACAAPGGKTTASMSVLPDGSIVVANEYDFKRAEILSENLAKWGNPNVVVSRGDTSQFRRLKGFFDIVAVDAPCSGEGMMRKDEGAIQQWSERLIDSCAKLQRNIIDNVWDCIRPGGYLIYSTCTFNRLENEENLEWIIREKGGEAVPISALDDIPGIEKGIDSPYPCYRFLPGKIKGEGLFMALIKKDGNGHVAPVKDKRSKPNNELASVKQWFNGDIDILVDGQEVFALPVCNSSLMKFLKSSLDAISVGVHAATIKGKDISPAHELSLSTLLNKDGFHLCEVNKDDALRYLHRDSICLPDGTPKGIVLLLYQGIPLGFVKNIGSRSNSLFPKNWRIKSQIVSK